MLFPSHLKKKSTAVAAIVLSLCLLTAGLPRSNAWGLTLSEEKELGRKVMRKIQRHFSLIESGEVVDYVQSVGNRVVRQLKPVPYHYRFYLVDQDVPNAFAIPGGYIFLYRGLMEMMDTEGELASIISHELAHIEARHIHERMKRGRILNIAALAGALAGAFLGMGGAAAQALATGALAGSQTLQLKYSRENEEEADRLGFRYLTAAGYDPANMASIMRKLAKTRWQTGTGQIPSYLSTHPGVNERVSYLESMAERYDRAHTQRAYEDPVGDFQLMQAALVSEHKSHEAALDRFEAWQGDPERSAAAAYGLGRLYLRRGQIGQAVSHLRKAAQEKPDSAMVLCTLGSAYYKQGRMAEAEKALDSALLVNPDASMAHFHLGLVLQEQGRRKEALKHLRRADELTPLYPEIDYHMGVLLGQMKSLGLAHFHLGRYHRQKRDWKLASFHYKKAKPLLSAFPDKQETIDEELEEIEERAD